MNFAPSKEVNELKAGTTTLLIVFIILTGVAIGTGFFLTPLIIIMDIPVALVWLIAHSIFT